MRHYPETESDWKDARRMGAADWQLAQLKLNPGYISWGPHEDYMWKNGDHGWETPVAVNSWPENELALNDLNEVVNFYFSINRENKKCDDCDGEGVNPETLKISKGFYSFDDRSKRWSNDITQDEVQALVDRGRLFDFTHRITEKGWERREDGYVPTAAEVNEWNSKGMGHDAINRWILIETRAKRMGVYGKCAVCDGHGYVFTEDKCHLMLTLWVIHPRKGASRGWEIKNIEPDELPSVYVFLRDAANRNANRFAKVTTLGVFDEDVVNG